MNRLLRSVGISLALVTLAAIVMGVVLFCVWLGEVLFGEIGLAIGGFFAAFLLILSMVWYTDANL